MKITKQTVKTAFISSIPVFAGYIVLGIGFGILLNDAGYGILWAFFMALTIYAGSMQYLAVDLLSGGATLITTAITTFLVNCRHIIYGISLLGKYKDAPKKKKLYMIFGLTDETYSLISSENDDKIKDKHGYYFCVSVFNQIYWVTGCVLGSILGSVLTISTQGVDFALTALFVTIFTEQWLSTKDHSSAIIGVVTSVLCVVIFGTENFLIPSMIFIVISLTVADKIKKRSKQYA